jgi:hypothetical protein
LNIGVSFGCEWPDCGPGARRAQYHPGAITLGGPAIEYPRNHGQGSAMTHSIRLALLCLALMSAPLAAQAACYADYKAKQDSPLRLHYGVIALSEGACARPALATRETRERLEGSGWTLLNVLSTFDASGLEERKANAGPYFLRF